MPIIIWGSRGLSGTVDRGEFHCPRCEQREEYALQASRTWFTIYFIPIFPVSGTERLVECLGCGQAYKESVLDYEPPSEADRFVAAVYEEFREGASFESMKRKLVQKGMSDEDAQDLLEKMCEGRPTLCSCGQQLHPDVKKCRYCGGKV